MRSLILLLLLSANGFAQIHQNKPIPEIIEESVKSIDDGIIGWSKSIDGQWISKEMTIPERLNSQNIEAYETNESELGMDNIDQLLLYKTIYGGEELYTLVKIFNSGYYKYSATKQKWQSTKAAYYYIFEAGDLQKIQDISGNSTLVKIPLRDYGHLEDVKSKKILESLKKRIVIKDKTDRILSAHLKLDSEHKDKIYFQLSSQHIVFVEVEGVLNDFKLRGNTIYNSPLLLDYLHYEFDKSEFNSFFSAD